MRKRMCIQIKFGTLTTNNKKNNPNKMGKRLEQTSYTQKKRYRNGKEENKKILNIGNQKTAS